MNTRLLITLLCTGAIAFACGPRTHTEASATATVQKPMGERASRKHDGELTPTLAVNATHSHVQLALTVENRGTKRMELSFPSGQTYDFVVLDAAGREVWRWAEGRMFTQALQNKVIDGGDSLVVAEKWEGIKPGEYTAVAMLKSSDHPIEQRVAFSIK